MCAWADRYFLRKYRSASRWLGLQPRGSCLKEENRSASIRTAHSLLVVNSTDYTLLERGNVGRERDGRKEGRFRVSRKR